jgi:hypothetical protein
VMISTTAGTRWWSLASIAHAKVAMSPGSATRRPRGAHRVHHVDVVDADARHPRACSDSRTRGAIAQIAADEGVNAVPSVAPGPRR